MDLNQPKNHSILQLVYQFQLLDVVKKSSPDLKKMFLKIYSKMLKGSFYLGVLEQICSQY